MTMENILTRRTGIIIYGWLIALTLAEVGIVAAGVPRVAGTILMAGTTLAKVLMIGLYFMHMKQDSLKAWLLPLIPVLLAVFFVVMLFPDLVFHLPLRFE
jgi:heme/copper-type cytochrome/quinol oxidase subunit 4